MTLSAYKHRGENVTPNADGLVCFQCLTFSRINCNDLFRLPNLLRFAAIVISLFLHTRGREQHSRVRDMQTQSRGNVMKRSQTQPLSSKWEQLHNVLKSLRYCTAEQQKPTCAVGSRQGPQNIIH